MHPQKCFLHNILSVLPPPENPVRQAEDRVLMPPHQLTKVLGASFKRPSDYLLV
jgi:hypothetical protein